MVSGSPHRAGLYLIGGHLLLGLGFLGMALPVLPTTVFWIGAAACYAHSSPEQYRRLISRGRTGGVIRDFLEHGVIAPEGKLAATLGMTIAALVLLLAPLGGTARLIGLLGLALGAGYVLSRPGRVAESQPDSPAGQWTGDAHIGCRDPVVGYGRDIG
jgi:uncharacterized membrane protein YbaN (DUF454 family)